MDFRLPSSKEEYPAIISALSKYSQEEQRVIMAEIGRKDLFFFVVYILNRKDLFTDWHFARMREVQEQPDGMLDLWFRGSGKTSIITHGMTIWNIMQDPEITIGICSWSRRAAIDIVKAIKTELESNELLKELYPDVLYENPDTQSVRWTEEKGLVVKRKGTKREATVEGTGLDTQATGRHWDIIVYDDIVSVNNVTSNEVIQNTTNALLTSFNLVSRDGKKRFIGTRYHTVDSYDYLIKNKIVKPRIYPATIDGTPDGEPCEIITKEQLEEKRHEMTPFIFSAQMLLNPVSDDERRFNPQLFQYYDKASLDKLTKNVYITVDAATSKKKGSDYSALAVMAVDALDNVYLVDLVKDKLNLDERKKKLFELVLKYKPLVVGYERYALMADTDYIRKCQETENIRFPIVELGGKLSKIERVDRFVPTFSNRKFYIPESLEYRDYEGKSHDLIQELKYEMINFPKGHDDCIDAISRIKDPELGVITPNAAGANSGVQEFAKFEFEL